MNDDPKCPICSSKDFDSDVCIEDDGHQLMEFTYYDCLDCGHSWFDYDEDYEHEERK